ncbi:MAG: PD-(D/E)XK nuclease family protein, partial [Comamonas sp.]
SLSVGVLEHDDTGKVDVEARELALTQTTWKLDAAASWRATFPAPTRRAAQSYTSLDIAFNNPALAVLQDAAGLRGCDTVAPEQDSRLLGTLAHRLVQLLLEDPAALSWQHKQVSYWFDATVDELLRCEGMPLLAPGNAVQLTQFKTAAFSGIVALLSFLAAAGVQKVEAERPLKGTLGTLALTGETDLLLHLGDGSTAALDLKWARSGRFRDILEDGQFLQLALYSHMVEAETGQAPAAVGYFTFLDGNLSTLTPHVFGENAWVVIPSDGQTVAQLVQGARVMWDWRVQQWREGEVDVFADGSKAPASTPPEGGLSIKALGPWHTDLIRLFGQQGSEA